MSKELIVLMNTRYIYIYRFLIFSLVRSHLSALTK